MENILSALPFSAAMLAGMLICLELGRRMGRRRLANDPDGAMAGLGTVEGAVFALYGLLLAFTFSGAPDRLDEQKRLLAEEANAINTAYLRLDLLAPDAQPVLRDQFRKYLDARLEVVRSKNLEAAREQIDRSQQLQKDIWIEAVAATRLPGGHPDGGKLLIPALNQMIDITTTQIMSSSIHPPPIIFGLLFLLALVCSVLAGFGMAARKGRSWLHILAFAGITVFTIFVILDIEYPRKGFIRLDAYDEVLIEVRESMK